MRDDAIIRLAGLASSTAIFLAAMWLGWSVVALIFGVVTFLCIWGTFYG